MRKRNRNLEKEAADRKGMTVEELRRWRADRYLRLDAKRERSQSLIDRRHALSHDAHVKHYRKQPEYQRNKARDYYYSSNEHGELRGLNKCRRMSDGWIASKIGLILSILPAPLIELKRQIIKAGRVCREIQQRS
jgi:hypothetical protein